MWPINPEFRWEPGRSHRAISRVDVWSAGKLQASGMEILDGSVTEKRVTGVRASLSLSVPPTTEWLDLFDLPLLEIRPYAGISWGRSEFLCPMGVFPVMPPERKLPQSGISINADDRWQVIQQNDLLYYWPGPAAWASALAARLMTESGLSPDPAVNVTKDVQSPAIMWDKSRHDLIAGYLEPIGAEAYVDRTGQPVIQDRATTPGRNLTDGEGGTVVSISSTADWSKVYNAVGVTSSKNDVVLDPVVVSITDPLHPAHYSKIGRRSMRYSSQLISNFGDAYNAAVAQLEKVSAPALSWSVTCVPDPTRMPGDLITVTTDLGAVQAVVQEVSHPLGPGAQTIKLGAAL